MPAELNRSTVADASRMYGRHPARPDQGDGRAELIAECERAIVAIRNGTRPGPGTIIQLLCWTVDSLWDMPTNPPANFALPIETVHITSQSPESATAT